MIQNSKPQLPDTIQAAIEETVGLRGDGEKNWTLIAGHLDMSEGVLRNKVAAEKGDKRHHLSLAEAIGMVHATGKHELIHAICKEFNGVFLHYPEKENLGDGELFTRYTSMMRELGQFSEDIHVSLADGTISADEIADLRKDFLRLSAALSDVMDRLQEQATRDSLKARTKPTERG
jgi:hypothetical protein